MLRLPVMATTCFSFCLLLFFFSCKNNTDNNIAAFRMLDAGYREAIDKIESHTDERLITLENKLYDIRKSDKAKFWHPKAKYIKKLSGDVYRYVDSLKDALRHEAGLRTISDSSFNYNDQDAVKRFFIDKKKGNELYEKLVQYKENTLGINEWIEKEFRHRIILTGTSTDTSEKTAVEFINLHFTNMSMAAALAMLSNLQLKIRSAEDYLITACDNFCSAICEPVSKFLFLQGLSSSYVKAGDSIEVFAGMGEFSITSKPAISIKGKLIALGLDGVATYKFKTPTKPGKYTVPVEVKYIDESGVQRTWLHELSYTTAQ